MLKSEKWKLLQSDYFGKCFHICVFNLWISDDEMSSTTQWDFCPCGFWCQRDHSRNPEWEDLWVETSSYEVWLPGRQQDWVASAGSILAPTNTATGKHTAVHWLVHCRTLASTLPHTKNSLSGPPCSQHSTLGVPWVSPSLSLKQTLLQLHLIAHSTPNLKLLSMSTSVCPSSWSAQCPLCPVHWEEKLSTGGK